MPDLFLIDDSNASRFLDEHYERTGGAAGIKPRDVPMGGLACAAPFSEIVTLIPKSDWEPRIKLMTDALAFPNDRRKALTRQRGQSVVKDQNGLNYCHLFAAANCMEVDRQSEGLPYIELAPESGGGAVGWGNAGGGMTSDIQYLSQHGFATRDFCPPHLHSPGSFKAGWQDSAQQNIPLEWFELGHTDMWSEVVTALLLGMPVYPGYDWWSHSLMAGALRIVGGEICSENENSWTPTWGDQGYCVLKGSKKIPSAAMGCFAIRTASWSNTRSNARSAV